MPQRVVTHPNAGQELRDAARYYSDRASDLTVEGFFHEIEEFTRRILDNPTRYSIRIADVRRANLKQFPYHINYIIHGGSIAIVAISHNKQRPFYWGERLTDRGWITG